MADSILRLKVESQEYDNKLKQAAQGLTRYADECRKVGGTLEVVEKETLDYVRALGQMDTTSRTATGKLAEMKKIFVELSAQYKQMTDAEKNSPFGKALATSLDQLKGRIDESKVRLEDINRELNGQKFGQFGGMIDSVGQKFGITGSLTEMLTSKTALMTAGIGASIAVITKATEAWAGYNSELAKQDQQTAVITGLKGDDADHMTDTMRALADTYNVDFRQAVEAANTLMSQFGESGDSAISIIKDGMQGMIQGDGPKLLQMIQQYAPAFRDAGVSARQLVAVIQNSEGGIFTDQNMNAIVMGIKNIRLMTKQTSDALAKMGIDGQKMSEQLSSGSLTVFDALKQVSAQLKNVDSNSQTAGEFMQTVFGRQGAMAGTNLAKAIEQLNTNLEETKKQTGEVGEAFADLQTANEKLNVAIREAFGYDGWDEMVTGIRSKLITVLAEVIDKLGQIRSYFSGENNVDWNITPKPGVQNLADDPNVDDHGNYIVKPWNSKGMKVAQPTQPVTPIVPPKPTKTKTTTSSKRTQEYIPLEGSIDAQTKKVQELQKAWRAAADDDSRQKIKEQIEQAQTVLDVINGKTDVKDVEIRVNSDEAMKAVENINGMKIDPKPFTVTADDDKAAEELKKLGAMQINDKTFSITANDADVLKNIQSIDGVKINPKSFTVTADDDEAAEELKKLGAVQINDKTFSITANDADVLKNIKSIEGVKIDPKDVTIKADTSEALAKIQEIQDVAITPKQIKIEPLISQLPSMMAQSRDVEELQNVVIKLKTPLETLQEQLKSLTQFRDSSLTGEQWRNRDRLVEAKQGEIDTYMGKGNEISGTDFKKFGDKLQGLSGGIASLTGGLKQMGIEIPQEVDNVIGVIQGLSTIIQGVQSVIQIFSTSSQAANTIALTANTAALWAVAATNAIPFAGGGIVHAADGYVVPGNSFSGDRVPAFLNSGEVVLNRAQQNTLASELQGNNMSNMRLVARVKGTDLLFSLENTLQMQGYGKIATWG